MLGAPRHPAAPLPASQPEAPVTITSSALFGSVRTIIIEHCGQRYTLRITRENKLILTK